MEKSLYILKRYWGYDDFRPPQKDIIESVLKKKDTIALLPTGGGKSICFQVPALIQEGKTLVISPLIALMQDQVDNLFSKGIMAKSLNSNLHYKEIDAILDNFVYGDLKILYISPERISSEMFITRITKAPIELIAVDEAHCISQWGYDFRPSYFNIPLLKKIHPKATLIALTATATPTVLEDIALRLEMSEPSIFQKSFVRTNLSLTVMHTDNKKEELLSILSKVKGCTIIYVRNRRQTVEVAQWLAHYDILSTSYHGGMDKTARDKNQQVWMSNQVRIMVSTNAFGMGIDKPDVRLVIHLDVAPSLEEYFQEAGRAGRDGKDSYAVTLINNKDISHAEENLNDSFPSLEIIGSTYDRLCRFFKVAYGSGMMETYDFDFLEFANHIDISAKKLYHILDILEKEGWVAFSDGFKDPSKVMVLADQQDLIFLQRQNDIKNKILVYLLRHYEGLFIDYVKVDETRIAKELKIDEIKINYYLNLMKSEGIIGYIPKSTQPQITFTQERPVLDDFYIERKAYKNRQQMAEKRLKVIIKYLGLEEDCRQKFIVNYFGEKGYNCGQCDICLGMSSESISREQIQKVRKHLKDTLAQGPINIKKYESLYAFNKRRRIMRLLKEWVSEEALKIDNFGMLSDIDL